MKFNIVKFFLIITAFFAAAPIFASEFSFDAQSANVSVGQQFKVDLNINTEKENINAVEGKIIFSADSLELSEIREGNSIVNFWVEKPAYKDGGVSFSGITPGGYVLDKGLITSLIFTAKSAGSASLKIENGSALLNDGNGTASNLKTSDLQINISASVPNQTNNNITVVDTTPPEQFLPEVSHDPNLFDDKWFVVFDAQDKDSGIEKYEIRESKSEALDSSKWIDGAVSPYVLADQKLESDIYIKAIDKKGNERIVKLSATNRLPLYENYQFWFIIVAVMVIVVVMFFRRRKILRKN